MDEGKCHCAWEGGLDNFGGGGGGHPLDQGGVTSIDSALLAMTEVKLLVNNQQSSIA